MKPSQARASSKPNSDIDDLFEATYGNLLEVASYGKTFKNFTVEDWIKNIKTITEKHREKYPNAKTAQELRNSPLYKALT
jgi:hypothetical protein